jgi:DNA-binding NarL/FixJ family response regulator
MGHHAGDGLVPVLDVAGRVPLRVDGDRAVRELIQLMGEGRSNLGIAQSLHLSTKTVETHVEHILDKLGIEPSPGEHRRVLAVLELLRDGS